MYEHRKGNGIGATSERMRREYGCSSRNSARSATSKSKSNDQRNPGPLSQDFSDDAIRTSYFDLDAMLYTAKFMRLRDEGQVQLLWVVRRELEFWWEYDLQGLDETLFCEIKREAEHNLRPIPVVSTTINEWRKSNEVQPFVMVYLDALGDRLETRHCVTPTTRLAGTVFEVCEYDPLAGTKTSYQDRTDEADLSSLWSMSA